MKYGIFAVVVPAFILKSMAPQKEAESQADNERLPQWICSLKAQL